MNKDRRKQIALAQALIEAGLANLEEAKDLLETAKSEEEEYKDNMHENLQSSEKYQQAEAAVDYLAEVIESIENFVADDLASKCESAAE